MLYFLLVLGNITAGIGQTNDWAPIGAKWVYNYTWCSNDPYCGIVELESVKDTVVKGLTCRLIKMQEIPLVPDMLAIPTEFEPGGPILMYEDSGKVFMYDNFNEEFYKLFDWTAQVGDTVVLAEANKYRGFEGKSNCHSSNLSPPYDSVFCGPMVYKVRSLDTIQLNGTQQIVQLTEPIYYGPDSLGSGVLLKHIVLDIGPLYTWMFGERPDYTLGGLRNGKLLCYSIEGVPIYEAPNFSCGQFTYSKIQSASGRLEVIPNPAQSTISLNINHIHGKELTHLTIRNLSGQEVITLPLTASPRKLVDVAGLPTGLYLAEVWGKEGLLGRVKFVKR